MASSIENGMAVASESPQRSHIEDSRERPAANITEIAANRVAVGDTVRVRYLTDDQKTMQLTISKAQPDASNGLINEHSPIAKARRTRSAVTWPSLALSRRRDATAQPSCSKSLLTRRMVGYPRAHGSAWMFLPANTPRSQQRSELSRSASMPGIVQAKKAAGSNRSQALVPSSPPPWSQKSVIGKSSRPDEAWRLGLGLFPSSIRPAARNVWVESQNGEIGICDGCSSPAPWPLSDMRGSMARGGSGLHILWSAGRSRLPLLRLPIRLRAWPGP